MDKNIFKFSFDYNGKNFTGTPETKSEKLDGKTVTKSVYTIDNRFDAIRTETEFEGFDAVYFETEFCNNSDEISGNISGICDVDMVIDTSGIRDSNPGYMTNDEMPTVYSTKGSLAMKNDYAQMVRRIYTGQKIEYSCTGGRSSSGTFPFFTYKQGNDGYIIALGWSGQWKLIFLRNEENVFIKGGIENADFPLYPHEKIRTMSAIILHFTGDVEQGQNAFRRLMKKHFSIIGQPGRDEYGPFTAYGWGGLSSDKMVERIDAFKRHELGFEYYWVDAGWYGAGTLPCPNEHSGDWAAHTGNWCINKIYHPDGFKKVIDKLKEANMKFLLWIEPERIVKSVPFAKEHPEMILNFSGDSHQCHINLGNKEAWDYIFNMLSEKIKTLNISCLRIDYNIDPLNFWLENDKPGEKGRTEVLYINGLYRLLDALLERFPHLIIDDCASGGRRIDIEMMKRSIPLWYSDYQCAFDYDPETSQFQLLGISRYLPYFGTGTEKVSYDEYRIRSAYGPAMQNALWGYEEQEFDEADTEKISFVKKMNKEYKRVRPYYSCDFYRLIEPTVYEVFSSWLYNDYENADDSSWTAYQFDRPEEKDGLLGFFRRKNSPFDRCTVILKAIDKNAVYTLEDLDGGDIRRISGTELENFVTVLTEKRMAKLYIYKKIEG